MDTAPADSDIFTGSFGLSESAAKRIVSMLESEPEGSFFRVAVNGGGCSGFQYEFSIDNPRQDDDLGFTSHGVEVVIDEMSLELVDNAELDYVQDLMGAVFGQQSERHRILRLRHLLLSLTHAHCQLERQFGESPPGTYPVISFIRRL